VWQIHIQIQWIWRVESTFNGSGFWLALWYLSFEVQCSTFAMLIVHAANVNVQHESWDFMKPLAACLKVTVRRICLYVCDIVDWWRGSTKEGTWWGSRPAPCWPRWLCCHWRRHRNAGYNTGKISWFSSSGWYAFVIAHRFFIVYCIHLLISFLNTLNFLNLFWEL